MMHIASLSFLMPALATAAFLFAEPMAIKQGLVRVTDAQKTTPLTIKLDLGESKDSSRISVSGMMLELSSQLADYAHPKMPGADGPHPQLSSGIRTLHMLHQGSYVDMTGKQPVEALNGCWEMVWREDALAGSLICGFDIPMEYTRNGASLPAGSVFVTFPIWNKVGLEEAQNYKEEITIRMNDLLAEKSEHMRKCHEDPNFIMKALHYRNAVATLEKRPPQNAKFLEIIPSKKDIILPLQDDLFLTTKGLVFSKKGKVHNNHQILLGVAHATGPTIMKP